MKRTLLSVIGGAAAGALATYGLLADRGPLLPPLGETKAELAAGGSIESMLAGPGRADAAPPTPQRLALYQVAAGADARDLRKLIAQAAALPSASASRFALEALLTRYAELDPRAAAAYAGELGLEAGLRIPAYRAWAREDAERATRALAALDDRRAARIIALALADVLGSGEAGFARLAEALPDVDPMLLWAEVIASGVHAAPADALRQALALDAPAAAQAAVTRVGEEWAKADPLEAIGQLAAIGDRRLRALFETAVLREWAESEPEAMLEHLAAAQRTERSLIQVDPSMMQAMASVDPDGLLALADRLSEPFDQFARQVALQHLARTDPERAIDYAESASIPLPLRQQYLQQIAAAYAASDPLGAIEWARSVDSLQPGLIASVLAGIARVDPETAIESALAEANPARRLQAMQAVAGSIGAADSARAEAAADRLLAEVDPNPGVISLLTSSWAANDPDTALAWLFANGARAGHESFRAVAQRVGQADPALAARYTQQVPLEARSDWIVAVAQGYAQSEPAAAVEWIEQFRGQPGYDEAALAVAQGSAYRDPVTAARLVESMDTSSPMVTMAVSSVAAQWAGRDAPAAAEWTRRLDHQARPAAVRSVAQQWAAQDSYAARNWVLSLSAGPERDEALGAVISATAAYEGSVDPTLANAFSSDAARQQSMLSVVFQAAQHDPDAARALIDEHLTDPQWVAQAEQMLVRGTTAAHQVMIGSVIDGTRMPVRTTAPAGAGFFGPAPQIR